MRSLGAGRRRSGQIPANRRPGPAERRRGRGLGSLGADFRARLGRGGAGEAGAPAARRGGRRGLRADEVGVLRGTRARLRALVDSRDGGGKVNLDLRRTGATVREVRCGTSRSAAWLGAG
jgi:hypothetical protein